MDEGSYHPGWGGVPVSLGQAWPVLPAEMSTRAVPV